MTNLRNRVALERAKNAALDAAIERELARLQVTDEELAELLRSMQAEWLSERGNPCG
jgi:hypothetical protein